MAEDEVTPEQLAAMAVENEEPEPVNYKPPAQKSVKEIQDLDKDDESLRKYKEALLGPGIAESGNAVSEWMNEWVSHNRQLNPASILLISALLVGKDATCLAKRVASIGHENMICI